MRRSRPAGAVARIVACAVIATLVAAGCGSSGAEDEWAGRGKAVSSDPREPEPPKPERSVDGVGGIQRALEARVIASAGVIKPVASSCDARSLWPAFGCKITYEGETVAYEVTTQAEGGFQTLRSWDAKPDAMIATRAGIEATMWRAYATRSSAISCDSGLPEIHRTAPGTTLEWRCYFKPIPDDEALGRDTSNRTRTVGVEITIRDGSIGLREVYQ